MLVSMRVRISSSRWPRSSEDTSWKIDQRGQRQRQHPQQLVVAAGHHAIHHHAREDGHGEREQLQHRRQDDDAPQRVRLFQQRQQVAEGPGTWRRLPLEVVTRLEEEHHAGEVPAETLQGQRPPALSGIDDVHPVPAMRSKTT